jgi:hypothetical protein
MWETLGSPGDYLMGAWANGLKESKETFLSRRNNGGTQEKCLLSKSNFADQIAGE